MADPNAARDQRRETRLLGALALTLAALAAWQSAGGLEEDAAMPLAQAIRPAPVTTPPIFAARDTSAIVERPLFAPGRRRVNPIAAAVAAEAPPPAVAPPPLAKKYMLVGILVVDGRPQAMLREIAGAGPTRRLREGEALDSWTLAAIEPRRAVRFQREGGVETLRLAHPTGGANTPQDSDEDDE